MHTHARVCIWTHSHTHTLSHGKTHIMDTHNFPLAEIASEIGGAEEEDEFGVYGSN